MGDSSIALPDNMAASNKLEEPAEAEHTPSSIESTPEPDSIPIDAQNEQSSLPQKRKGGRKPIYATSEERKQRNRQAQAAFRERRTEYIKQLEATIKQNDETLATLQQSHRSAADECLMLRYKNSLLERILLEKGIDVQSELQMKTGSPTFGPNFMHPSAGVPQIQQPQPGLQRAAIQRQHARRSGQTFMNKDATVSVPSPQGQPTPSSHASSPTAMSSHRSPVAMQQHPQRGATPPAPAVLTQSHQQQFQFARSQQQQPPSQSAANQQQQQQSPYSYRYGTPTNGGPTPSYYTSPFQKHIDQLGKFSPLTSLIELCSS
ncbi:hypothetical protein K431DRAFT_58621 [Polychaeton citri CBS 116435]|uniref:BZIP domain-containing protein n=1 Tax=Polychaeton citri CBS 116435 TaxID=1314669 RepID=A0A9P4UNE6_9PEZI|nr:hypothetical protein K431DRAFT_58621 [Polychaeton citri CBS 116435]